MVLPCQASHALLFQASHSQPLNPVLNLVQALPPLREPTLLSSLVVLPYSLREFVGTSKGLLTSGELKARTDTLHFIFDWLFITASVSTSSQE
jgi:hypothetical protein